MGELSFQQSQFPSADQDQKQSHRLIVSEKHQQAIELLQYPGPRLKQWIQEQLQENPMLELEDAPEEPLEEDGEEFEEDDIDWDELVDRAEDFDYNSSRSYSSDGKHREDRFRAVASEDRTLQESLRWQLGLQNPSPNKQRYGELLISYIDKDGRFTGDLEEISEQEDVTRSALESVLELIQGFDPPGVGGRDLEETLLIQMEQTDAEVPDAAEPIVRQHLEDLQNRYYKKIARSLDISPEQVQATADLIQNFEPRPGRKYEPVERQYITPDVTLRKLDGEYVILINDRELPPLRISSRYRALLKSGDEQTRDYVKDKLKGALWVIQCIYQRHQTLHQVTESILQHQMDFFENGVSELKPLILKDVAEDIDVHESTVSRAVQNKYLQTHRGLYPFKFFFSSGLDTTGDRDRVSSTAIKARIQELVEEEDKTDPLSDRSIKEILNDEGVEIGRRTISKYRKDLLIPPYNLRKRLQTK